MSIRESAILAVLLVASSVALVPPAASAEVPPGAVADIAEWATIKEANGPAGRPLPLAGSWVCTGMFGPRRMVEMIKQGHHVMPTLGSGPGFLARYAYILENKGFSEGKLPKYMAEIEPVLAFCAEHKLPISMGGHNWATGPARMEYDYNRAPEHNRKTFTPEESVRLMVRRDGKVTSGSWKMSSPFGPEERWREFGRWWMDNPAMQTLRKQYPDPPMVVWLNNNEAGEIGLKHLDWSLRFQETYGDDLTKDEKVEILHKAYDEKYAALFDEARNVLSEPAWKENTVFVAYNAWPRSVKGRTEERNRGSEWKRFDGTMPEFYLNDWQIYRGKTDYNYWSPQTEGLRIESSQNVIFELDPDHYFASIAWDGGQPAARRSSINCLATGMYGSGAVQRWDFARYEGMVQFGLWAMRPRVMREFRWPVTSHDAYDHEAFMAVVRSADRVWDNETLAEFWRFGTLEKSEAFRPPDKRVAGELRFYSRVDALLPVDVNPSRDTWPRIWHFKAGRRPPVKLRVLALALRLGEAPNRRWLIYAHAPLGAVDMPSVEIPDLGKVQLPFVSRSGSFFTVAEGGDAPIRFADPILRGGPPELALDADRRFLSPGESVTVTPVLALPPVQEFASFQWTVGADKPETVEEMDQREFTPVGAGLHMIRLTGTTAGADTVVAETPVFVGRKPAQSVVYDVELSDATAWRGPWKGIGKNKSELLTYRLVPNPGRAADPVLHGGRFVHDDDLGRRVLELASNHDGLWGERSHLTCNKGYPNLTISLRFKAESLDGTQVLYAQGGKGKGYNIYLHEGTLYAGIVTGGHWLSTDRIEPGKWHHVSLVLNDATEEEQPDKLHLYLDGETVATGPGTVIPNHHAAPRVGLCLQTTLHNGEHVGGTGFRGRIADFRQVNAAVPPTRSTPQPETKPEEPARAP